MRVDLGLLGFPGELGQVEILELLEVLGGEAMHRDIARPRVRLGWVGSVESGSDLLSFP
jgi:hypothetical protein